MTRDRRFLMRAHGTSCQAALYERVRGPPSVAIAMVRGL